jgi:hypothetical protein
MNIRSLLLAFLVAALCAGSADARMCERFTTDLGCVNRCMTNFIICKSTAVSGAAAAACQAGYDACRRRCRVCLPDPFAGTAARVPDAAVPAGHAAPRRDASATGIAAAAP